MSNKKLTAKEKQAQEQQKKTEMLILCIVAAVITVVLIGVILVTVLSDGNAFTASTTSGNGSSQQEEGSQVAGEGTGDGATLETAVATHYATIEIENYGTIKAELYGNTAPISVENFVTLAQSGFYDGLTFHRIIEGFMMQGGAGTGASTIKGEFAANGIENNLLHERGVLSMARTSVMDSATSQFFIVHETSPHLDGDYAAFGMVIEGIEVVDAICEAAQPIDGNGAIAEADQPVIKTVTIEKVN